MRFSDALDRKAEDIQRPPNAPMGTYIWQVSKLPVTGNVGQGRFDTLDFIMACVSPGDDVDTDELEAYGDLTSLRLPRRFMFNTDSQEEVAYERSLFQLRQFIEEHLQVEWPDNMSLSEVLTNCINAQCAGVLSWRPDPKDPETVYQEISSTAPLG